jgi:hypothetical protein
VTLLLYLLLGLVIVLQLLILSMTHGKHFTPQAYYRKRRRGANFVLGLASMVPRPRKESPEAEDRR